jgi:AraC family transcriptional regulator
MEIYIKNMVCNRCIMVVAGIFRDAGLPEARVQMGKVFLEVPFPEEKQIRISSHLQAVGFEIINDSKSRLIERIKNIIIDLVYNPVDIKVNYSHYLADELNLEYNYLSTLFSLVEGTTIEKFTINMKTERVKELLVYDEKTLSEIAFEMGYSSTAHLSAQFKKVTGFTPTWFKNLAEQKRKSINNV